MDFIIDSSIWIGLLTLLILEIVLGIDNIVLITMLSNKLPTKKREHARVIGLVLGLLMRLGLLSIFSWTVTLTQPLLNISTFSFSGRDLIFLLGGMFLLFKSTTELHERLDQKNHQVNIDRNNANYWTVVMQIIILDAVFSLDAVITAVGMVNNLPVMMAAVVLAMAVMLLASRALTRFVNRHQTIVVLCLSFLLMIGLSLIAEGFNCHIPKGYLYAAIGFSILIELFNQIAQRNFIKNQSIKTLRECASEAIMRLMGRGLHNNMLKNNPNEILSYTCFSKEERYLITGLFSLASRSLRSIMTPRNQIIWLDCQKTVVELRATLMKTPHNMFPVCNGTLDQLIGIVRAKDLMSILANKKEFREYAAANPAILVQETLDMWHLLRALRQAKGSLVVISNEFGIMQGLVTPLDVLEAITNEHSDKNTTLNQEEDYEKDPQILEST